jgi:acyl-CoA synthetase (AMP-forming)/AMP-acid ligase II
MPRSLILRRPAPALVERYRREGFWIDRTLGAELEAGLIRNAAIPYKVWSDIRPFDGKMGDIHDRARRIAAAMRDMGVGPGDIVSFQLPNWIEAVETFIATMFLGAISVPIVQIYGHKELAFVLAQTQAKVHVTTNRFRHLDYRAMMEGMRTDLPVLEHVIYIDDQWDKLSAHAPLAAIHEGDPDAPAVIGYTSGTTSDPKGAIHTSRSTLAEIRQRHCNAIGDDSPVPLNPPKGHDEWLVASPVAHVSGLQTAVLLPILLDRRVNLIDRWDIDAVLDVLEKENLSLGAAANFFFNSVINHPQFRPEHLRHMKYITSGGSPVPRAFGEQCEALGILLVRAYGSTEHPTAFGSAFVDPVEKRIGTDGRLVGGVDVELRDFDGNRVPVGSPGEIYTRGPDMFVGYVDASLNDEAIDADGWFRTGDIGILDADGYYTITDRAKDIIIRGGENISAAEVEDSLCKMPGIVEVAAVAAPDDRMGERVCAFLKLADGLAQPTMEAIRAHLTKVGLARQKWPEEVRVIDEFERTASGKIKKFRLREDLRAASAS